MVRSAIFSWAVILLLAGLVARYFQYPAFAEAAVDLAIGAFIAGMLIHVISSAADVLEAQPSIGAVMRLDLRS